LREQLARQSALPEIVSVSELMKEAIRLIERVAPSEASVLITGESGTGKELVAHAIHRLSNRAEASFVDLNCAAFQESLLESELFGYEAGAFSGAKGRKLGLIELADGGTLFLDEVTELPAQLQAKLLRAIETRTFFRVGGVRKVEVNVRIVAATNRNLETVVNDGVFRSDLLYRINGFQISLAPLRERPEDIPALVQHFLNRARIEGLPAKAIEPEAMSRLTGHRWPGNVRELENLVRRLAVLYPQDSIGPEVIEAELREGAPEPAYAPDDDSGDELAGVIARQLDRLFEAADGRLPSAGLHGRMVREVERPLIVKVLAATRGNQLKAAALLGLNRNTLRKKIRELDIEVTRGSR
jgi:two-component system nitrogen regulation response regulator GlnG